jgi:predicted nucleic acid-binding protein
MVVADTSSVNYAILIGEIEILHQLYEVIAIPGAVRVEARRRGLPLTGLIGALLDADEHGLTDLAQALAKLRDTTFHLSPKIVSQLLKNKRQIS